MEIVRGSVIDYSQLLSLATAHAVRPQLAQLVRQLSAGFSSAGTAPGDSHSPDFLPEKSGAVNEPVAAGTLPSAILPEPFSDELNEACTGNLMRQLNYIGDFFRVKELCDREGIRAVPFKGFWLAHEAYGDTGLRESADVDLLTDVASLEKIRELMPKEGYVEEERYRGVSIKEIKRRFREYNFERYDGGKKVVHIEFHWGICPPGYGMPVSAGDLAEHIVMVSFQGREMEVLTPTAHMLLLLLHHGGKDRFHMLKQVNDIAMLMKNGREIDWHWLQRAMTRYHALPLLYTAVSLAVRLTGVKVPEGFESKVGAATIDRLADNRIAKMALPPHRWNSFRENAGNWWFRMRTRTGLQTQIMVTAATVRWLLTGR